MATTVNEDLIRNVVEQVLGQLRGGMVAPARNGSSGTLGVFQSVDDAVAAAEEAYQKLGRRGVEARARAIGEIRRIVIEQAEELGRLELEETKIGRLDHKIEKLVTAGEKIPGVEFLRTNAFSGDHGVSTEDYAPFGVIGAITPVTHSLPTLTGNAINMIAAGNTLVVNPHPSGARIAAEGVRRFNAAIRNAIGIENLITIIEKPTLEAAQAIFEHRGVKLICVTGGPGVARAALASRKRAIVAGPGNPPVVVDETADLDRAAASIVQGGAYDNNLLCIGEKEVFAVEAIFEELMSAMGRHGAVRLSPEQINALTEQAIHAPEGKDGKGLVWGQSRKTAQEEHAVAAKDFIGKDAAWMAQQIGLRVPPDTQLLYGETGEDHPFVAVEQMMPFVPFVRAKNVESAIALAKKYEHGFKHTAILHSRNIEMMTRMGRELDTTLFIVNGPSVAGLGLGGEGYLSFSIAGPTGEGVTTPLTFTRQRRSSIVDGLRMI